MPIGKVRPFMAPICAEFSHPERHYAQIVRYTEFNRNRSGNADSKDRNLLTPLNKL